MLNSGDQRPPRRELSWTAVHELPQLVWLSLADWVSDSARSCVLVCRSEHEYALNSHSTVLTIAAFTPPDGGWTVSRRWPRSEA